MPKQTKIYLTLLLAAALRPDYAIIIVHPDIPDSQYRVNTTDAPLFVSLDGHGQCADSVIGGSGSNPSYVGMFALYLFA